jgi:hypothetical protein
MITQEKSFLDRLSEPPGLKWLCPVLLESAFDRLILHVSIGIDKTKHRLFFVRPLHGCRLVSGSDKPSIYVVVNTLNVFVNSSHYCLRDLVTRVQEAVVFEPLKDACTHLWLDAHRVLVFNEFPNIFVVQVHLHVRVICLAQEPAVPELLVEVTQPVLVLLL